jgi:hypothetical protein
MLVVEVEEFTEAPPTLQLVLGVAAVEAMVL